MNINSTGENRSGESKRNANREKEGSSKFYELLHIRDFRLLWLGEGISLIGDQFYMIALPWLVLQITGDVLAMSTVLALAGVPRALFMMVGGVITDRLTPRLVMFISNILRLILVSLLTFLVLTGQIQIWMIYIFALVFGLIDAFFFPAQNAIVPGLVKKDQLQTANAILQGTMQLSLFAGPVLAGMLIAYLAGSGASQSAGSMGGIAIAFGFDALTFLVSAITLWLIKFVDYVEIEDQNEQSEGLLQSIKNGLVVVWNDVTLRTFFMLIALSNFLVTGPVVVGIPFIANSRLPEGAAAYGIIMSAYGGGSLLGIILAGSLPRPSSQRMGLLLGIIWSGLGIGVLALGLISTTVAGAVIALLMGLANGYVVIIFVTWLQQRTHPSMLGRVMSLLMFSSAGLLPISNMLTGMLIKINPVGLFIFSGSLMTVFVLLAMFNPSLRRMDQPNVSEAGAAD